MCAGIVPVSQSHDSFITVCSQNNTDNEIKTLLSPRKKAFYLLARWYRLYRHICYILSGHLHCQRHSFGFYFDTFREMCDCSTFPPSGDALHFHLSLRRSTLFLAQPAPNHSVVRVAGLFFLSPTCQPPLRTIAECMWAAVNKVSDVI